MIDQSPLHARRSIARGILKGAVDGKARQYLALLLMAICLPGPGFGQLQEKSQIPPVRPKMEIRSIVCEELKEKLSAAADQEKAMCMGTAYTQRLSTCMSIVRHSIALAQSLLTKVPSCPESDVRYARAIEANSRSSLQIFENYAAELERRAGPPSATTSDGASSGEASPRRCWVVSQQCQDCNVNGCFPYVCNSRTECE